MTSQEISKYTKQQEAELKENNKLMLTQYPVVLATIWLIPYIVRLRKKGSKPWKTAIFL